MSGLGLPLITAVALLVGGCSGYGLGANNNTDLCGNGEVDIAESCDGSSLGGQTCESLGYQGGMLGCSATCELDTSGCTTPSGCNNGVLDPGEECDGSNLGGQTCESLGMGDGDLSCTPACRIDASGCANPSLCGNGQTDNGEVCDDGNTLSGDGCSADCASDESCGNGIVDVAAGEACDDGNNIDGDGCQASCSLPGCGDGVVDPGEACDDGNNVGGDGCSATCTSDESCGNGIVDAAAGEACDDGNSLSCDGCSTTCRLEGCGNGVLECLEACDDGNTVGGDGCSADCTSAEICGNGVIDLTNGEQCDSGDLGGQTCVSRGYTGGTLTCNGDCTFNESGCTLVPVCGNGNVEPGEDCDDGNLAAGDGCDATCHWEQTCGADSVMSCNTSVSGGITQLRLDDDIHMMTSCSTNAATGPEDIVSFVSTGTGLATVHLDVSQDGFIPDDLDVYILEGACNPHLCLDYADSVGDDNVDFPVVVGQTYYIVVELDSLGFPPLGDYTLTLNCP